MARPAHTFPATRKAINKQRDLETYLSPAKSSAVRDGPPSRFDPAGKGTAPKSSGRPGALRRKRILHGNGGVHFDGLAIEKRGAITPLANRLDCGSREARIDLAVHHAQREWFPSFADNGVQNDSALDARRFCGLRVFWLNSGQDFRSFHTSANPDA